MQLDLFDPPDPPRAAPTPLPPDQAERDAAIDPRRHVVLEASAGTGKTRVLVDRYVRLIEAGVDPRNILAMTFTRKAAAEMRERILKALDHRARDHAAFVARWRALRERLADINISTIDAFCFGLLREFPLEADVDPAFEIADETVVPRFVAEAIELTLRDCRGLLVADEHLRLLFAKVRPSALRQALERLLDHRYVAAPAVAAFVRREAHPASVDEACRMFVDALAGWLRRSAHRTALVDHGPAGSPAFRWLRDDLRALDAFPAEDHAAVRRLRRRLAEYFLRGGTPRQQTARVFSDQFATAADKKRHNEAIRAVAPEVEALLRGFDVSVNRLLARGLERVLAVAIRRYEALLAEHSVLDFPGMLHAAVGLLSRREEFARSRLKLQSRYQHLLLDEFQDTSRLQWQLVTCLIDAWSEGAGPEDAEPTIFVVGDRKQSIYRFRQAEVRLLEEAAVFIEALRPDARVRHAIQHSFRAVPELLAFVNALGAELRGDADLDERFDYRDSDRFPAPPVAPGARRDGQPVLGVAVGASIDACAGAVADEAARLLVERTPVRDSGGVREIQPEDIAILFRSRAGHRAFEDALEARGIATYVYKGLGFFDAPEVQDLQALIRYLARPDSSLRAAEFLRSRFVRLSDAALLRLAPDLAGALAGRAIDPAVLARLDPADAGLFAAARAGAARWLPEVDRVPPGELLDRILDETAYPYEMRGRRLSQARENVKKVRALVRRIQNRGYATVARIADYFETVSAGDESNAIVAAKGCVQLMTIHAAKGLEFPVVFLVRLSGGAGGRTPAISVVVDDGHGAPDVAIAIGSDAKTLETRREMEESRRLLYVAVTRARDRLYLGAEVKDGRLDRANGALATLLPLGLRVAIEQAAAGVRPEVEWQAADGATFALRVCPVSSETPPSTPVTPPAVAASAADQDLAPLVSVDLPRVGATSIGAERVPPVDAAGPQGDRLAGTLVHRLFQREADGDLEALVRVADALLTPDERADADAGLARRAAAAFLALRRRSDVTELLGSGVCQYEVPFACRLGADTIVRGTIDCLVRQRDGTTVILEFKTGRRRPEHEIQVGIYRAAVAALVAPALVDARLVYASDTD